MWKGNDVNIADRNYAKDFRLILIVCMIEISWQRVDRLKEKVKGGG